MAIPGLAVGVPAATPATLIVSLALAFLTLCVGHSVGLHRGIIHRTYEVHPAVRDLWQNRPDCPRYFAYEHALARDSSGSCTCASSRPTIAPTRGSRPTCSGPP
jgi:stearoyl-CoA desaturase (delta-9 desaturase)